MKTRTALALAALLLATPPAFAAQPTVAEVEGSLIYKAEDSAGSVWRGIKNGFWTVLDAITPSPTNFARRVAGDERDGSPFWTLLKDAGYKLKEVHTDVGIIPGISATFVLARELSEADREYVERRLDKFAAQESGLVARMQRGIINVLLEASELGKFQVDKLDVVLLPLPKAAFSLAPTEMVLSDEHSELMRVLDEIRGQNRRYVPLTN
ncbi:MAG: hypothetical protein HQL39_10800 [Alphaproteobacteria bacterium]|nr:hypothetical protein [Alphaproteobacteria bacterium]